jgi:hypothetical protein
MFVEEALNSGDFASKLNLAPLTTQQWKRVRESSNAPSIASVRSYNTSTHDSGYFSYDNALNG